MVDVTELVWKLIIAVAPIIVSAVFSIIQATIARMSEANQNKIRYWVGKFVDAAQMLEPNPAKRKAWVVSYVDANNVVCFDAWNVLSFKTADILRNHYEKCCIPNYTDIRIKLVEL